GDDWSHFVGHAAGNDDQVALPRGRAKHFGTEAGNIEPRRAHGHHLNGAAGQTKRHGPDGTLAHPVDRGVERGEHQSLGRGISEVEFWGHGDFYSTRSMRFGSTDGWLGSGLLTPLNYSPYNFIKIHRTLRTSPAMAAGVTDRLWSVEDLVALWEAHEQRRAERAA